MGNGFRESLSKPRAQRPGSSERLRGAQIHLLKLLQAPSVAERTRCLSLMSSPDIFPDECLHAGTPDPFLRKSGANRAGFGSTPSVIQAATFLIVAFCP